jgi:CHAD domain-containing protein
VVRTGSLRTQSARHRVDHGTICGRSCANSGRYKPLCACLDRTFVNPIRRASVQKKFRAARAAPGDALTLVAHGASKVFNLTLPQRVIDRALKKDRAKATAEYLAEFRTDLEGFVALRARVRRWRKELECLGRLHEDDAERTV